MRKIVIRITLSALTFFIYLYAPQSIYAAACCSECDYGLNECRLECGSDSACRRECFESSNDCYNHCVLCGNSSNGPASIDGIQDGVAPTAGAFMLARGESARSIGGATACKGTAAPDSPLFSPCGASPRGTLGTVPGGGGLEANMAPAPGGGGSESGCWASCGPGAGDCRGDCLCDGNLSCCISACSRCCG